MLRNVQDENDAATILRGVVLGKDGAPALTAVRNVAKSWPATVAHEAQRLIDELLSGSVAGTLWQLCDFGEVICRFSALVMIADLHAQRCKATELLLATLFGPRALSMGGWVRLVEAAARAVGNAENPGLLVPELAGLFMTKNRAGRATLERTPFMSWTVELVEFRNATRGHGSYGAYLAADAVTLAPRLIELDEALAAAGITWPSAVRMRIVTAVDEPELMGPNPLRARRGRQIEHCIEALPIELVREADTLRLSPLLTLRHCVKCGEQDGFLYDHTEPDKNRGPKFVLLDYLTGHHKKIPHFMDSELTVLAQRPVLSGENDALEMDDEVSEIPLKQLLIATDSEARSIKSTYLLNLVRDFCDQHDRGMLLIEGPGNIGKSVAMTQLEEHLGEIRPKFTVVRFAVKRELQYSITQLDLTLADRLRSSFQREEKDGDATLSLRLYMSRHPGRKPAEQFCGFLDHVMRGPLRPRQRKEKLVLVLDGLDELRTPDHGIPIERLLPQPQALPQNCILVMTTRPVAGGDVPQSVRDSVRRLDIEGAPSLADHVKITIAGRDAWSLEYQKLLHTYFEARIQTRQSALAARDSEMGRTPDKLSAEERNRLFEQIKGKSEGLFGYMEHLTNLVVDGLLDIDGLRGLPDTDKLYDAFFDELEHRFGGGASGKVWEALKQVLLALVTEERAFECESQRWHEWLPPREYRGVSLADLSKILGHAGITHGLVWTLYAFKPLLASWRGSETIWTHWRLGLRDLRRTLEARWPDEIDAAHRFAVNSLDETYKGHWNELAEGDSFAQDRFLSRVWHAACLPDQGDVPCVSRDYLDALSDLGRSDTGRPLLSVRANLAHLQCPDAGAPAHVNGSTAHSRLAIALNVFGFPLSAVRAADRAVDEATRARELAQRGCPPEIARAVFNSFVNRGVAKAMAPSHGSTAAILDYDEAIRIGGQLADSLGDACAPAWRVELAGAYVSRGNAKRAAPGHGAAASIGDYDTAIHILVGVTRRYDALSTPDAVEGLAAAYMNRGVAKADSPGFGLIKAIEDHDEAIRLLENFLMRDGGVRPPAWHNQLAAAYTNRGMARQSAPDHGPRGALDDYNRAFDIRKAMIDKLGDSCPPDWQNDLASTHVQRGGAKQNIPEFGAMPALHDLDAAIEIRQRLVAERGNACPPSWLNDLAAAIRSRGNAKHDCHTFGVAAAIHDYDQAIEIFEQLNDKLGETCPPPWRYDLASAYMQRGHAGCDAPGYGAPAAVRDHDAAIRILQDLIRIRGEETPPKWRCALAAAHQGRGLARGDGSNPNSREVLEDFDAAIRTYSALLAELGASCPPSWRMFLASAHAQRGDVKHLSADHGPIQALGDFETTIDLLVALLRQYDAFERPNWRFELGRAYLSRGCATHDASKDGPLLAIRDYEAAIGIFEELTDTVRDACPPRWRHEMARAYTARAHANHANPALGATVALTDHNMSVQIREALVQSASDCPPAWRCGLAAAYHSRAVANQDLVPRDPTCAIADLTLAIDHYLLAIRAVGDDCRQEWLNYSAFAFSQRAVLRRSNAQLDASIDDLSKAIEIREALIERFGTEAHNNIRLELAATYRERADTFARIPNPAMVARDQENAQRWAQTRRA